ncbi:hypothetical protein [Undibacterium oligocarboniphilum]|uniref:Pilin accessory protein (PilO) n=1 Tax=Undibacterium oligocarboniphilum TaxID=666702 RepID=A0A850QHB9_9BURK|nr:hypothetical protein [Undibacterium oligocarboniphilum]MBC3871443.1 hypothetical protein [Undibacterium oligocarboniphilum]NVO78981.1 hypothetical protein [Undibacterium oligocarboniphilum]
MIFTVDDKSLATGLDWSVMISSGSIAKEVRAKKGKWYWNSVASFAYGILPIEDKVTSKNKPVFSAAIAFASAHPEGGALAVLTVPGSESILLCGVFQGRPVKGFDSLLEPKDIAAHIEAFQHSCGDSGFNIYGDVVGIDSIEYTIHELAKAATEYAELKKVGSNYVNPLTLVLAAVALYLAGDFGYQQFAKYRQKKLNEEMASKQKSAQQIYDEALAQKKKDFVLLAADVPALNRLILSIPSSIGGWDVNKFECGISGQKLVTCDISLRKGSNSEANNKSFLEAAEPFKFKNVIFKNDLQTISALKEFSSLPFLPMGDSLAAAEPIAASNISFQSVLQKVFAVGAPGIGDYKTIALNATFDESQLTAPPLKSAPWSANGPLRMTEIFQKFPKTAIVEKIAYNVNKNAEYGIKQSMVKVEVQGQNFSKPN